MITKRFSEQYGVQSQYIDDDLWLEWLGIYSSGWQDALESQNCVECGRVKEFFNDTCLQRLPEDVLESLGIKSENI